MNAFTPFLAPLALTMACSPMFGREIDLEKPSSKLRRFASDVIFEVEAGDREKYSKRLPEFVMIEFHGQPGPKPIAEKHLAEFVQLAGLKVMDKPAPGVEPAKIGIYFGPQDELARTAREIDRQITMERGYTYWTWWNSDRKINRAVVMIATDKVAGPAFEDRLIEQLLGVFGFPARSKEFDESCLSSKEPEFSSLQPVDKALLSFYYRAVPAGTKPTELDEIFKESWTKSR